MLKKFFLVLLLCMLAEVCVLIFVGQLIGWLNLILILLLSIVIGLWTVKRQGFTIVQKISEDLSLRRIPGEPLLDGACLLLGGFLLCVPGLLSDCAGILLLIPAVRMAIVLRVRKWIRKQFDRGGFVFRSFR
ncbi:FxsA family protein [Sporolactobacillus laevolacticus]|uniref:Exclusion suppressor FxsA n=1 Tax=Sporolactobacillus laevolacticus DSM 442 TaxID=1395513 RepID=V6J162_9BACL|nr:FxsA family protein [Sporolactobacillus laevolacticus]EST13550.1 exclusion suppressor FxsA [Sporolactobacillus laevolacticus DSM 442]MDN3955640.1 FxsA family protein [Sporolactobacillus laevolacticus]